MAAEVAAITGLPAEQAAFYLDMAGGSVEAAVAMFFDGGQGGQPPQAQQQQNLLFEAPPCYGLVWPDANKPVPDSWSKQDLTFGSKAHPLGLEQPKNGPCGVLAALHALVLSSAYTEHFGKEQEESKEAAATTQASAPAPGDDVKAEADAADVDVDVDADATPDEEAAPKGVVGGSGPSLVAKTTITDAMLVGAIFSVLQRCARDSRVARVCLWKDKEEQERCGAVVVHEFKMPGQQDEVHTFLSQHVKSFQEPGGAVLLVYSAVETRGVDQVRRDVLSSGGELPLVFPPFFVCSSEVVSLLLRGNASGNVGAFTSDGKPHNWDPTTSAPVGMLSNSEKESGIPLCDTLKNPAAPVWLLHGGDHFTVLFADSPEHARAAAVTDASSEFELWHWNGLPPGGPRMAHLRIKAPKGARGPAPKEHKELFFKPEPGEIEDVIQAHPGDKKENKDQFSKWRFEVILTVKDDSVQGKQRPPDMPAPPKFEQGPVPVGEWRCAWCYHYRFKTMCFGQNPAPDPATPEADVTCAHCNKPRSESGWSLWMKYEELPDGWKATVAGRHAPKIVNVLITKWRRCDVTFLDDDKPAST